MTEICHCGKPLHYNNKDVQCYMDKIISDLGRYITVCIGNKNYKVDRHYIALHGLEGRTIDSLGFEVINDS